MRKRGLAGFCGAFLLAVVLLVPASGEAATYYVDNVHGSDMQRGTSSDAWKSLTHATAQLTAGDTLIVKSNGPSQPYREQLTFHSSGILGEPITVVGYDPANPAVIVGSIDLSDGPENRWYPQGDGIYALDLSERPDGVWITSKTAWEQSGIATLTKRSSGNSSALQPGQWSYLGGEQKLVYALNSRETIEDLHIEGVTKQLLMDVSRRQHITVENLSFHHSAKTALAIQKSSGYIELKDITVSRVEQNAMVVTGSSNVHISDCTIEDARNNGIVFNGSEDNPVSHSSISGCKISRVLENDCITLHKNSDLEDVGSNLLIQNNELSACNEQGIDVTSGTDVRLIGNVTHNNGDSGIVLGHGVSRVEVFNHLSVDDGRYAGLLINDASDVQVSGSCVMGSEKHQLQIIEGRGVTLSNNVFYQPRNYEGSLLDIADGSSDITFVQNQIVSESVKEVVLLRYLQGATPSANRISYFSNVWSAPEKYARRFYTDDAGKHAFDEHAQLFGKSDSDTYVPDMTLSDMAFQVSANRCDPGRVSRSYMASLLTALENPAQQQSSSPAEPQDDTEPGSTTVSSEPASDDYNPDSMATPGSDSSVPGNSTAKTPQSESPGSTANADDPVGSDDSSGTALAPGDWTTVTGNIYFGAQPICALVLINGQSQFTCDGNGSFDLFVPVDDSGNVTVMSFADGFAPVTRVLQPHGPVEVKIDMVKTGGGMEFAVDAIATLGDVPGRATISGTVTYGNQPVCALVLANGRDMFSCGANLGTFELDVPLDSTGSVSLMTFVSGFKPYQKTFNVTN